MNSAFLKIQLFFGFFLICFNTTSQSVILPEIPEYDSVKIIKNKYGKVTKKIFSKDSNKVFIVFYNPYNYPSFFRYGNENEDSCYIFFNPDNGKTADLYIFGKSYTFKEHYDEKKDIAYYKKYDEENKLTETGNYYLQKEYPYTKLYECNRYKIGKEIKYDKNGQILKVTDYDNCTINGKDIFDVNNFNKSKSFKKEADRIISEIYGKKFMRENIVFNLDKSGYKNDILSFPETEISFLYKSNSPVALHSFSYDIKLNDKRFNLIRLSFSDKGLILYDGLGNGNKVKFHKSVLNRQETAAKNGFNINDKNFAERMRIRNEKILLIFEEINGYDDNGKEMIRQLVIDTKTGKQEQNYFVYYKNPYY